MTRLEFLTEQIQRTSEQMASVEAALAANRSSKALSSVLRSLRERGQELETEFAAEAAVVGRDVCNYRILLDDPFPRAAAVGKIVSAFQTAVTVAYAALQSHSPRLRARVGADIEAASGFTLAYTYPGSLGMALLVGNQPALILDDGPMDHAIRAVFELAQARTTEAVAASASRLGPAAVRAVYDWASIHTEAAFGADIQWSRRREVRAAMSMQPPEWAALRSAIEATSEARVQPVRLSAMLVRFDSENRSFRLAFEEADHITGHLDEDLMLNEPARVPARYTVDLEKTTRRQYSTNQDSISWVLKGLQLEGDQSTI